MSLVHAHSKPCSKSELELFEIPPTQMVIEDSEYVEYRPFGGVSQEGSNQFIIPGVGSKYLDINNTQLYIRAKITKGNGADITSSDKVGPVNLLMHSLFSQVSVTLNGKLITDSTPTYPYRAMIETLLNYNKESKESHLQTQFYYKDTAGGMDENDPTSTANKGLRDRASLTDLSAEFELMGPIHSDIFNQENVLLPGIEVKIMLERTKSSFALMSSNSTPDYCIKILDAILYVRELTCSNAQVLRDAMMLENETAKYKIRRAIIRNTSIPAGSFGLQRDNVFLGEIPKRVILVLVDGDAFSGVYDKNPFNFKHHGLNYLAMHADSKQIPRTALTPKFGTRKRYLRSYLQLFSAIGEVYSNGGIDITPEDFGNGYTILAFDLTPDESHGEHYTLNKRGNFRIDLKFDAPLSTSVNLLMYAEFDNIIEIDKHRNTIFDFST